MRHGLEICCGGPAVTVSLLVELGQLAEQAGWDGVFFEDYLVHHAGDDPPTFDPWLLLAAIAGHTSHVRLGTTVTALPRRRPAKLAREVLTLDHLSGGRAGVAVGVGDPGDRGLAAFGEQTDLKTRAAMLDEGIDLLLGLLGGDRVTHHGTHYRADGVSMRPAPVQSPRVPVWIGGSTQARAVLRRAARADGIVPYKLTDTAGWSDFTPTEVRDLVAALPAARADGAPFDVALGGRRRRDDERAERAYLAELAAAGATWWLEYVPAGDPETMRAMVARGPLR
ncbi:LLM class flavin-dependent oxidoreductase [Micromonospora auratinigra]|uniref:Flavin-dependent oxidoreductase, luciferase family (Includes alkanesulfonate monooxygenase SsuD and methylene tetrahydromethanopterin reductase) n=1 Tax=Micromonospora auratinigra TaxID=261654 RepID=A0A1A8ZCE8_9ACTN|nr:LLM class flavin-dependent oxidoreductase [Micromonospora auratinigra]SBT41475.1 Flavin-dependent oxidoreductase, luciferase family (includes alkanesulfonate monooxygenase SsuD and methylene tetrahydromethanopterin reductase) [Micromonospora auratinigra]